MASSNPILDSLDRIFRWSYKAFAKFLADRKIVFPFVYYIEKRIQDINGNSADKDIGRPALLALQPVRFSGELEILHKTSPYRILVLPLDVQNRLLMLYYPKHTSRELVFRTDSPPEITSAQQQLRTFLTPLLGKLYPKLNIVGTVTAGAHYWRDIDIGSCGRTLDCPWIIIHRENFYPREAHKNILYHRFGSWKPFEGDAIIVHNVATRDAVKKTGFCGEGQIVALGSMRMDSYVQRVKAEHEVSGKTRKLVTLFSFREGVGLINRMELWSADGREGWAKLFDATHSAMVLLAAKRPDIDVVIKFKPDSYAEKRFFIALERNGISADLPSNFSLTQDRDPQNLIIESDVVVGFGTTALLEAAIARKPVVFPNFEEAVDPSYEAYAHFADRPELFDVAGSREEMLEIIEARLENPAVDEACMQLRLSAFDEFVSSISGNASETYVEFITGQIEPVRRN